MNTDFNLWSNISTKTIMFHKNYDIVQTNDNIITEYVGKMSKMRLAEKKTPITIAEFSISVWNIELSEYIGSDLKKLLNDYKDDDTYKNMLMYIENSDFNFYQYKKIVFIHSLVIKPDYKKHGVTEEFVEFVYKNFYDHDNLILALVKPLQNNKLQESYFFNEKMVSVLEFENKQMIQTDVPAIEYYSLTDLYQYDDDEISEYKLFALASRCGFERLNNTYLFKHNPEKTIKRLINKQKKVNSLEV